jgi:hypothetical protein
MLSRRFQWVFCQLEVLRHTFPTDLRCTLEELPKSLDETYKRILNRIKQCVLEARVSTVAMSHGGITSTPGRGAGGDTCI